MAVPDGIKEDFRLARCCNPKPGDEITGFLKTESGLISVHRSGCPHLRKIRPERLTSVKWDEILPEQKSKSASESLEHEKLDDIDLAILRHHAEMGVDYAAVVAKHTRIDRATVFERHRKLRNLKLLARVQPKMIRYRKGIVRNRWIKHRNHTYYELTEKGQEFLRFKQRKGR
jgi:(p)ppGpp synthase/HD superfamily hydrolase